MTVSIMLSKLKTFKTLCAAFPARVRELVHELVRELDRELNGEYSLSVFFSGF